MELYKKYRPKTFKEVIGQSSSVKVLQSFIKKNKLPHTLLFTGPSGCGKTTLARILRRELKCGKHDFTELDCADFRGIDMVRNIRSRIQQAPISGKCRIWIIDECHKLTNEAQNAFLKMLEDTPNHVYFMLATTDPQKLRRTIRTRSTEIVVRSLNSKSLNNLLVSTLILEQKKVPDEVIEKIIECSDGSARKALVLLNQVVGLRNEDDMIEAIKATTAETQAIAIARALFNPRTKWSDMAKILKETVNEEPEQIRWMVLGYAKSILLSGGKLSGRAYLIIEAFRDHFYDSKWAGLTATCYEIIIGTEE